MAIAEPEPIMFAEKSRPAGRAGTDRTQLEYWNSVPGPALSRAGDGRCELFAE
jgi:hypothetical protein